jgi:hypothetical protein
MAPNSATLNVLPSHTIIRGDVFEVSLAPGTYTFEVNATGYVPFSQAVVVSAGATTWWNVSLVLRPPVGTSDSSSGGLSWSMVQPYALGGVAGAGIVIGIGAARRHWRSDH